jgi:hypothetical protein
MRRQGQGRQRKPSGAGRGFGGGAAGSRWSAGGGGRCWSCCGAVGGVRRRSRPARNGAHFVVDRDGTIHQLVSLGVMCRHTVGLNYTAIGIENVGYSDQEILHDSAELRASLELTHWLRCRYGIVVSDVIGHNESLTSPYHHENVPSLRTQTHSDWRHADMNIIPCASASPSLYPIADVSGRFPPSCPIYKMQPKEFVC